jgi:dihydropteroate synthase
LVGWDLVGTTHSTDTPIRLYMTIHTWHLADRVLSIGRRPLILGIVNVTPDSFSDGGVHANGDAAAAHGLCLVEEGADLLDIGGESSRPGAVSISLDEELRRVLPVVTRLAKQSTVPISIDTTKAEVARACLGAGAHVVNDITALVGDAHMANVVADAKAGVILMHMQGTPQTMQIAPHYDDVLSEVGQFLESRLQNVAQMGIPPQRVALDPGIGFGKKSAHNLRLIARLDHFQKLGRPVCLGVSRKGIVGQSVQRDVHNRLAGSLAVLCHALSRGAVQIIRVHDVKETRDVASMWEAIESQWE